MCCENGFMRQRVLTGRWRFLLLASCLTATGCGQRLFKGYSSLRPKYAALQDSDSTIRSQNAPPVAQTPGSNTWSGHSVVPPPRVRLLTPDFGRSLPGATETVVGDVTTQARSVTPDASLTGSLPASSGHSYGSERPMQPPEVSSSDPPPALDVITIMPRRGLQSDAGFPETAVTRSKPDIGRTVSPPVTAIESIATQPSVATELPSQPTLPQQVVPAEDRSMLDRLRDLYDNPEEKPKSIWRRNLERLSNPLGVFRERNTEPPSVPAPLDVTPPPSVVSELSNSSPVGESDRQNILAELIQEVNNELLAWPRRPSGQLENEPEYRRRQQDLRLLYLVADQPGHAIETIVGGSAVEQEFWQELMLSLAHFRSRDELSYEERMTVTAGQLKSAVRHLAKESVLTIRRLEICSQINSFGRINLFPSNDFEAGQPLLLYAEIENFGTAATALGTQKTSFDATLQILHTDRDTPIETLELKDITDEASSDRTDYFQSFELTVPSHLAPGEYLIRLNVNDKLRKRSATETIPFQVR